MGIFDLFGGLFNGQHRNPSTTIHSSTADTPGGSPGGANTHNTYNITGGTGQSGLSFGSYQRAINPGQIVYCPPGVTLLSTSPLGALGVGAGYAHPAVAVMAPPHPPTALKSEDIRAGEIIAWRAWSIYWGVDGARLKSMTVSSIWEPDRTMAGCPADGYGIHAYKDQNGPLTDGYVVPGLSLASVIGRVALWGDIIEHTDGYRAQFAAVHSLDRIYTIHQWNPHEVLTQLREIYLPAPKQKAA